MARKNSNIVAGYPIEMEFAPRIGHYGRRIAIVQELQFHATSYKTGMGIPNNFTSRLESVV